MKRKRFFVAIPNARPDVTRQVLALNFTPTPDLFGFGFKKVLGPFRRRSVADVVARSVALFDGLSLRAIERHAEQVLNRLQRKAA